MKSKIGKISKYFLEDLNTKVRDLSLVNQWQETNTVINVFRNKMKIKMYFYAVWYCGILSFSFKVTVTESFNKCENFSKYQWWRN